MKILLPSSEGRDDIIAVWRTHLAQFWSDCPYEVVVWSRTNVKRFSRDLEDFLRTYPPESDWLIWLDDQWVIAPVNTAQVHAATCALERHTEIAIVQLTLPSHYAPTQPSSLLPGFAGYDEQEPLYKRTLFAPSLWRGEVLRRALAHTAKLTEAQELGWSGFYNFELGAAHATRGWTVLAPTNPGAAGLVVINAVTQGQWSLDAVGRGLVPPDSMRPVYQAGRDPFFQRWQDARTGGT